MRLSPFIPIALTGLFVLGCSTDPTEPPVRPISINTGIASSDRTQLLDAVAYSYCNDEFIPLTGTIHEVFSFTETAGGVFKMVWRINIHAVATHPATGESMVVNFADTFVFPDLDSFFEGTDQSTGVLVTKGSSPNEVVRYRYHLTITPDGTVTSSFEDFTITC